ncbi:MAG: phosphate ABC transporter permease PstA [Paenibacillaceae bacterium]|jgi:phosphate transport system permease protein|nr:phosphate ABC transporter permease PstA [Paenibacillaceae bacterium]
MFVRGHAVPSSAHTQVTVRRTINMMMHILFFLATCIGIVALMALIANVLYEGIGMLRPELFENFASRRPLEAGLKAAIVGTALMVLILLPIAFVFGVGTAIFLEEYAPRHWVTRLIQINISTLAGVPSIVYGILGLALFVNGLDLGRSLLAGSLTMTLLVLPIIIVSAQEAIRAVPNSRRDASYALGATKWQTVSRAVLPSALPGILTGIILAVSRAIGETAPLIMVGALTFIAFLPSSLLDQFTVLPIQIYNWISRPQIAFHELAAAGIIVLLVLLLSLNISAVAIRNSFYKK